LLVTESIARGYSFRVTEIIQIKVSLHPDAM